MKKIKWVILLVLVALFVYNGIYTIQSGQEAVITRFGQYVRTESMAGLKWKIPLIERRYMVNVAEVRRMEFGYQTNKSGDTKNLPRYDDRLNDSLMLTGDENLINVETAIQYKIVNSEDFLFNVDDPIGTLEVISVSTIRRSVANNTLDEVLTENKVGIQQEIRDDIQTICDFYNLGIQITAVQLQDVYPPNEVNDAFQDIARAKLDKESKINEAQSFENKIIPKARGEAAKLISEAEAYREERIKKANGDVANFNKVYEKYVLGKQVTRTRMYLETIEDVLPKTDIYITSGDDGTIKFLPLQNYIKGGTKDNE